MLAFQKMVQQTGGYVIEQPSRTYKIFGYFTNIFE
jgi:hypothetical protein